MTSLVLALAGCPSGDDAAETGENPASTSANTATGESASETLGESESESETGPGEGDPRPARVLMSSDWRAKRLSLLDYAALRDGAQTREEALWKTIQLDAYEPGPLEAELTPDGSRAVVAIAPGFFAGAAGALAGAGPGMVPEGGAILVVDLVTESVLAEIETAHYPMGIAITPNGNEAWTANYGGNGQAGSTVSHIDLVGLSLVEEFEVGPGPEQLDLDTTLAIINTASDGSVRLFDTGSPLASLSAPLVVSDDPSWVLHIPGADRAVAINSLGPAGYSFIDTSDVANPTLLETIDVSGIPYAATRGYADNEIIMSILVGTAIELHLYDTDTGTLLQQVEIPAMGFPLGLVFAPEDDLALVPVPGANVLVVADFSSGESRVIPWQDQAGPTYLALE